MALFNIRPGNIGDIVIKRGASNQQGTKHSCTSPQTV